MPLDKAGSSGNWSLGEESEFVNRVSGHLALRLLLGRAILTLTGGEFNGSDMRVNPLTAESLIRVKQKKNSSAIAHSRE